MLINKKKFAEYIENYKHDISYAVEIASQKDLEAIKKMYLAITNAGYFAGDSLDEYPFYWCFDNSLWSTKYDNCGDPLKLVQLPATEFKINGKLTK